MRQITESLSRVSGRSVLHIFSTIYPRALIYPSEYFNSGIHCGRMTNTDWRQWNQSKRYGQCIRRDLTVIIGAI